MMIIRSERSNAINGMGKLLSRTLRVFAKNVHENAVNHGWWDEERSFGELIALCHSELSEALEEYRKGHQPDETYYSEGGEWAEGYYVPMGEYHYILTGRLELVPYLDFEHFLVNPETVSRFSGLTDRNGTKIFEGDIIRWHDNKVSSDE